MKNLHLMSMASGFNTYLIEIINERFPHKENCFVWKTYKKCPAGIDNVIVDPKWFDAEYINRHHAEWDQIFLHELFLTDRQILFLSDEAAKKITWVVWGHDLYRKPAKPAFNLRSICLYFYRCLRQYSIFFRGYRNRVADKVSQFRRIAIGYSYDEVYIRKKYGTKVPVVYGPYFSKINCRPEIDIYRTKHLSENHEQTNILLGHCGAKFNQHEKYLRKLSKYKNENIHIILVLSYLASPERIEKIRSLSEKLFQKKQITILTELMPRSEYYTLLSTIDIGIFPFVQQSGLGNTTRLAYMGAKLFLNPKGVLYKGFSAGGVQVFDCNKIGHIAFREFSKKGIVPKEDAPLFDTFDYERNIRAWETLLQS